MRDYSTDFEVNRRDFMLMNASVGAGLLAVPCVLQAKPVVQLKPTHFLKRLRRETGLAPIESAVWYIANDVGDGIVYRFPKGLLAGGKYLTADILVDGNHLVVFLLTLEEGEDGPTFRLNYKALNQCLARIRFPLESVNLNRWLLNREGAWLKPICGGERADLNEVDRITVQILHKSDRPARWCQTPITVTDEEPPRLAKPLLPKGPLLDEFGQSIIHKWPTKTRTDQEVTQRLMDQLSAAPDKRWPRNFSPWGGWKEKQVEGTGFFRKYHDGRRWWFVDPEGYLFWSTGLDCVRPDTDAYYDGLETALTWMPDASSEYKQIYRRRSINYLIANFIRAFGPEKWYENWAAVTLSRLRDLGFNTVANWSDWKIASDAKIPYVRPLSARFAKSQKIYRDFPDVFHPDFQEDAENYAQQLLETVDDSAMIGYFLMNEPTWAFSQECPAAGMLFNTTACETRKELSEFLRARYEAEPSLAQAWAIKTSFAQIAEGKWKTRLTEEAKKDLLEFSSIMVEKLFKTLSDSCKKIDPNHMNLGVRYQGVPPEWAVKGMKSFDVFSMNCYRDRVPYDTCKEIGESLKMPVVIGEFHFGSLDAGLPSPGLVHVRTQADRGKAYRVYLEDAAANPYCVGAHYFTLYDQSALGRSDGENYNIGFLDVCNRPYEQLAKAARQTHERLYQVAAGEIKPYDQAPEYLPRLF